MATRRSAQGTTFSATDIYLISGGQIVEEWNTLEQIAVLEQIGAVPEPE